MRSDAPTPLPARAAALLERLEAVPLSPPEDPLGFEGRLADENGWTLGHACAVVREYRRFLVLTQVCGEPVCPSGDVDEAWHLHITRTADYARLCAELPGGFLHHQPSRGGRAELDRHRAMYGRTLASYSSAFGRRAPAAVWPEVDDRFAPRRPAPAPAGWRLPEGAPAGAAFAGVVLGLAALAGWTAQSLGWLMPLAGVSGEGFLFLGAVALFAIYALSRRRVYPARGGAPSARDTLDPLEAAWLAGGVERLGGATLALMVAAGHAFMRPSHTVAGRTSVATMQCAIAPGAGLPAHPAEAACRAAAGDGVLALHMAREALEPFARTTDRRLGAAGLASDPRSLPHARSLFAVAAVFALMAARVAQGLHRGRPVSLLLGEMVVACFMAVHFVRHRPRATPRGQALLARLKAQAERALARRKARTSPDAAPAELGLMLAMLGAAAVMDDGQFAGLQHAFGLFPQAERAKATDGGGSGSGCSADADGGGDDGGCGGGCGGCGGGGD